MSVTTWAHYDQASERYFKTYEALTFSRVHRAFLKYLPPSGASCLDVGSGSGRDANALAKRGYQVTAVEPSSELRRLARLKHKHPHIVWIDDKLPQLPQVKALKQAYDFILASAVWMHIAPAEQEEALNTLADLLRPEGHLALTIRYGPTTDGRLMYETPISELIQKAQSIGLRAVYQGKAVKDAYKRDILWRKLVFRKTAP